MGGFGGDIPTTRARNQYVHAIAELLAKRIGRE
jgi:hypothetical protein